MEGANPIHSGAGPHTLAVRTPSPSKGIGRNMQPCYSGTARQLSTVCSRLAEAEATGMEAEWLAQWRKMAVRSYVSKVRGKLSSTRLREGLFGKSSGGAAVSD